VDWQIGLSCGDPCSVADNTEVIYDAYEAVDFQCDVCALFSKIDPVDQQLNNSCLFSGEQFSPQIIEPTQFIGHLLFG
jgi:hypothetical protein